MTKPVVGNCYLAKMYGEPDLQFRFEIVAYLGRDRWLGVKHGIHKVLDNDSQHWGMVSVFDNHGRSVGDGEINFVLIEKSRAATRFGKTEEESQ